MNFAQISYPGLLLGDNEDRCAIVDQESTGAGVEKILGELAELLLDEINFSLFLRIAEFDQIFISALVHDIILNLYQNFEENHNDKSLIWQAS